MSYANEQKWLASVSSISELSNGHAGSYKLELITIVIVAVYLSMSQLEKTHVHAAHLLYLKF
jgi:hypothetical protein